MWLVVVGRSHVLWRELADGLAIHEDLEEVLGSLGMTAHVFVHVDESLDHLLSEGRH